MIEYEGIFYLELEDALSIYGAIFGWSAAAATDRLRNRTGLESALDRPQNYAYYHGADIALQAAVLAHGIAENQPFIDGNKRTAYLATIAFLGANGYVLAAPQAEVAYWIEELSAGLSAETLAERLRDVLREG